MPRIARFLPIMLLLVLVAAVWASGLYRHLSWAELARHQAALVAWTDAHRFAAPALFLAVYAAVVLVSLPIGAALSVVGGLLFGTTAGGALSVLGATLGAIGLFLVVRSAVAPALARRGGKLIARIRPELERDGFLYLLAIRLVPGVPVLGGESGGSGVRHAAAAFCRRHAARNHADDVRPGLPRPWARRRSGAGRAPRSWGAVLARRAGAAMRACRYGAAPRRLAACARLAAQPRNSAGGAAGCLTSTWR